MQTGNKNTIARLIALILSMLLILAVLPMTATAAGATDISSKGLSLIKCFEGCRLTAYKPVETEEYYTIGWGHYGSDVKKGQTITQAQADAMLVEDMKSYVKYVSDFATKYNRSFTQNQFDALVSFTYNNGSGWMNPKNNYEIFKYMSTGQYTAAQISDTFTSWCHAGGEVLAGLYNRRQTEVALLLTPDKTPYEVWQVTTEELNYRKEATTASASYGTIPQNTYIVITAGNDQRKSGGYLWGYTRYYDGKASNMGWCALNYAKWKYGSIYESTTTTAKTTTVTTKATTKATTTINPTTATTINNTANSSSITETSTEPTLSITTTAVTEPTTSAYQGIYPFANNDKMGDANYDGEVNIKDILLLRKYLARYDIQLVHLNDTDNATGAFIVFERADINGDGVLSVKDSLMLLKHLAGYNVSY